MTAAVTFKVTTYWKRKRGESGLTMMASRRLTIGQALDFILDEFPPEAITVTGDGITSVTTHIDWTKVPDEIRFGKLR